MSYAYSDVRCLPGALSLEFTFFALDCRQILLVGLNPGRAKHTTLLTISAELPVLEGTTAALYHPGKLGIIGPMPVLVKPNIVDCRLPNMHLSVSCPWPSLRDL